tara:strand:+ start:568 stop:1674 length:1107 start_codon:yes stop_codon:yes gene_type:complete
MKDIEARAIIKEIMSDAAKQSDLYVAGNFWKFYERNLLRQIDNNELKKFRSWRGGSGIGTINSFHGGELELSSHFGRYFHPYESKFSFLDENFLVEKYNGLINKLASKIPFLSYFALRAAEGRKYFFSKIKENQENLYRAVHSLDKELVKISDSKFGDPLGFYVGNKFYTSEFLKKLIQIDVIKKNTDFDKIENIVEIGAGIGLLASCFLKLKSNLKYLIIDIPPSLFFSEYYLKNIGFKVFGYKDLQDQKISLKEIFKKYQVCILPPWRLDLIADNNFDLLINVRSFQEMEKEQSINYIKIFKKCCKKYIYLNNSINEISKANKQGSFGSLNPTSKSDLEKELVNDFEITYSREMTGMYETVFKRKL